MLADFEQSMDRSPENINLYALLLATVVTREILLPLQKSEVAALIEFVPRKAEDGAKLSLAVEVLSDVVKEADYIARQLEKTLIEAGDVTAVLVARKRCGGSGTDCLKLPSEG